LANNGVHGFVFVGNVQNRQEAGALHAAKIRQESNAQLPCLAGIQWSRFNACLNAGVNGCRDQIIIHSHEDMKYLMVVEYVFPVLIFVGKYALENNVTGLHVGIKRAIRVSAAQGYKLKRILKGEHHT